MNNYLPQNLKYLLKRFGVNQSQLALQLKVRQTTISNWINKISMPSVDDLVGLYHFFGISCNHLLLSDLANGNLITDDMVAQFQANGNLKGNPIGNLNADFNPVFTQAPGPEHGETDADYAAMWVLLKEIKELRQDVSQMRDLLKKEHGKKH